MNKVSIVFMVAGVLFVSWCVLIVIQDIVKAVYHQFKGDNYEWYSVKALKENRVWWKWAIALVAFIIGAYWMLPNSIVGEADFRAFKEKPDYTAYYECEYDIEHYGKGKGYAELRRENSIYSITRIFVDGGHIILDRELTAEDEIDSSINLSFCNLHDSSVRLVGSPVKKEVAQPDVSKEVFGYPNPTKEYCLSCRSCGAGYYARCANGSEWLCPDCSDECKTYCDICFEKCPPWRGSSDDYVICEHCLGRWFQDEDLRYYFGTGEWS